MHLVCLLYCFMLFALTAKWMKLKWERKNERNISYRIHDEPNQMNVRTIELSNVFSFSSRENFPFIFVTSYFDCIRNFKLSRHASCDKESVLWLKVAHTQTATLNFEHLKNLRFHPILRIVVYLFNKKNGIIKMSFDLIAILPSGQNIFSFLE